SASKSKTPGHTGTRVKRAYPESRDSGFDASHRPGMTVQTLERTDRKIAQPQIGVAALFPKPEQRPVQRLPQQVVALAHRNPDALAEIAALDEGPARKGATLGRIGAVDPERQRNRVAENEIDLAAPQARTQALVIRKGVQFGVREHRLQIGLMRSAGDHAALPAFEKFGAAFPHHGVTARHEARRRPVIRIAEV